MNIAILTLGALGHVVLWVAMVNRLHGLGIKRRWVDLLTIGCGLALGLIPIAVALVILRGTAHEFVTSWIVAWSYIAGCAVVGIWAAIKWCFLRLHHEQRGVVLSNHTSTFCPRATTDEPLTAPGFPTWLARLPRNQALDICVHEKELAIPGLLPPYDGLRIAHLSDLHMSGRIRKGYFERVVQHTNRLEADLIAITGDIVERSPCIDWIPDTLGRLTAPAGVYYVLGNHDRHVDRNQLNVTLRKGGLIHLGGSWRQLTVGGASLILAGNELPWFSPAADMTDCPIDDHNGRPLRILLSHSPDQFRWAQEQQIDLMLAGHNHGGQVRLPLIGAILAPSLHGVRYAAGAFQKGKMVMHVSRGTSCLTPLRYNCPPEIALLVLRSKPPARKTGDT